jgi:CBS domain-containing protein
VIMARRDPADIEVREVMRPGVVALPEDASVLEARRAMLSHDVHAVLVVQRAHGRPLGLVTPRKLPDWIERDEAGAYAREAIGQAPVWIRPDATVRVAVEAILEPGITHVLVRRRDEEMPEGVVTARDLLPRNDLPELAE